MFTLKLTLSPLFLTRGVSKNCYFMNKEGLRRCERTENK